MELELPANLPSARFVGTVRANLRTAWALYAHSSVEGAWARTIDAERAKLATLPRPAVVLPGTRAMVWDSRPGHDRHVLELAYDFPAQAG